MEPRAIQGGAKTDERSRRNPIWERGLLKGRISLRGVTAAFAFLFLLKILISMLVLSSDPVSSMSLSESGLARAQDRPKAQAPKAASDQDADLNPETLYKKSQALKAKEMELKKKEEELLPLKKEIEEKLAELNELQTRLTNYAKSLADREQTLKEAKVGHLVELYAAMEPGKAAAIMDKLKMETVVSILRGMKGKAAGQILAMMKPELGAAVSERLSKME